MKFSKTSNILSAWNDANSYIYGSGSRTDNNSLKHMQGLSLKSLKHHKALQPLFIIMGGGMIFVAAYIGRLATKSTDINWTKEKDPLAVMDYYKNRQFKMLNPAGVDFFSDDIPLSLQIPAQTVALTPARRSRILDTRLRSGLSAEHPGNSPDKPLGA